MRLLCLFILMLPHLALACGGAIVPWNQAIDFEEMERFLAAATPRKIMLMSDYLTSVQKETTGESESYYVEFSDTVSGIFKPEDELWNSYGEVGAYQFSRQVRLPYIAPTIIREISWSPLWTGRRHGSLQYIIKTRRDTSELTPKMFRERVGEKVWSHLVSLAYPLGQWDFYGGNLILDDSNTPALIDNAAVMDLLFFRYGDFPFIYKGNGRNLPSRLAHRVNEFPYHQVDSLVSPSLQTIRTTYRHFVGPATMQRWYDKLGTFPNRTLNYVIWENSLWMYWNKKGLSQMSVTECEPEIVKRLLAQSPKHMATYLPQAFSLAHRNLIEDRTRQFAEACRALAH